MRTMGFTSSIACPFATECKKLKRLTSESFLKKSAKTTQQKTKLLRYSSGRPNYLWMHEQKEILNTSTEKRQFHLGPPCFKEFGENWGKTRFPTRVIGRFWHIVGTLQSHTQSQSQSHQPQFCNQKWGARIGGSLSKNVLIHFSPGTHFRKLAARQSPARSR